MEENQHGSSSIQTSLALTCEDKDNEKMLQESSHLTDMETFFPELVWDKVLQKITKTYDIKNCSNSSTFFFKFLQKKREISVVLPKVFVLLVKYFNDDHATNYKQSNENSDDSDDYESDNDSNRHINPMNYILKCRGICKSWNKVIEDLYQNRDAGHFMLKYEMMSNAHLNFKTNSVYSFHLRKASDLQKFQHHFDPTHYDSVRKISKRNPFLERKVEFLRINFKTWIALREQVYTNEIVEILTKYGSEVWYACLDFHVEFGSSVHRFYEKFNQFLQLMPNLKVLRVNYTELDPFETPQIRARSLRIFDDEYLQQIIFRNPLSSFPNLKFIDSDGLPTLVFNELIDKNCHITQLQVEREEYHGGYNIFTSDLPNLTALNIQFCTIADYEKFESCRMPINLKRFYFWYEESSPFFPWSRLFRALDKLGENCEELLLQLPTPKNNEQIKQVLVDTYSSRLNLPSLKRITILDDRSYCLDFLLPCEMSLEILVLRYKHVMDANAVAQHMRNQEQRFPDYESKQKVKFVGFKEKMEESNIWSEFIKLKEITIHRNFKIGGCITYFCNRSRGSFTVHRKKLVKLN